MSWLKDLRTDSGRCRAGSATNVPAPFLRCTSPSLTRRSKAWRTVIRDTEKRSTSSLSAGSRVPGVRSAHWRRSHPAISS